MTGNVQFLIGQTYLSDFWKPIDEPASFGIEVDFGPSKSLVHVALAWSGSGDSGDRDEPVFRKDGPRRGRVPGVLGRLLCSSR